MTDLRTAAQQALEALEYGQHTLKQISEYQWESRGQLAMDALRAALAEPVQDHEDWCASVTQLLLCDPPRKAPCNCKKKQAEPAQEQNSKLWPSEKRTAAITALRTALAQEQAEPVQEQAEPVQEQEPLGWAVQIGTHSAGRRQGKPRYVLFFNKSDAEHLADRTMGARPEPFYLEEQR